MGGGPCGESGICDLTVEDAKVIDCENDTGTTPELSASFNDAGGLEVIHQAAETGCCPEFSVGAELSLRTGTLTADYLFANDLCECICALDVGYTITGIPEGEGFTLMANGSSLSVGAR
jgi:hypothetical protein